MADSDLRNLVGIPNDSKIVFAILIRQPLQVCRGRLQIYIADTFVPNQNNNQVWEENIDFRLVVSRQVVHRTIHTNFFRPLENIFSRYVQQ